MVRFKVKLSFLQTDINEQFPTKIRHGCISPNELQLLICYKELQKILSKNSMELFSPCSSNISTHITNLNLSLS